MPKKMMKGKAEEPSQGSKTCLSAGQAGNPLDPQKGPGGEKVHAKLLQVDQPEPLGHLRSIPFEQAREAFLLLLRETGRGDMEYVCRNVLRNVWDADDVRVKVEQHKP